MTRVLNALVAAGIAASILTAGLFASAVVKLDAARAASPPPVVATPAPAAQVRIPSACNGFPTTGIGSASRNVDVGLRMSTCGVWFSTPARVVIDGKTIEASSSLIVYPAPVAHTLPKPPVPVRTANPPPKVHPTPPHLAPSTPGPR